MLLRAAAAVLLAGGAAAASSASPRKHVLFIVCVAPSPRPHSALPRASLPTIRSQPASPLLTRSGDDVGYSDFGIFNDQKTITPTIDGLIETGIHLADYYTFKICSPSRGQSAFSRCNFWSV